MHSNGIQVRVGTFPDMPWDHSDEKESYFELLESARRHAMLGCLRFLFLQLRLVSRQCGFLAMSRFLLEVVSICQLIIHRRRVVVCDVIRSHGFPVAHADPDCRVCAGSRLKGLIPFVRAINQPGNAHIR